MIVARSADARRAFERQVGDVIKAIVLSVDGELREATPVKTGHARANWVPSIGTPHVAESQGDGAHAAGVASILSASPERLAQRGAWESNNVPYINRLNEGSSQQAPANFVQAAIRRGVNKVGGV